MSTNTISTNDYRDLTAAWLDSIVCKWSNPKYVNPKSTGPFEEGDVRWDAEADCYDVYFKDKWWDRGAFLMGRVSAIEEHEEKSNMELSHMEISPKQKQVIEALMDGAVAFPPKWEQLDGAVTVFVPMSFEGKHGLPKSIDADLVTIDKEGEIVRRFSITYKGTMQFDEVIKLLEMQQW